MKDGVSVNFITQKSEIMKLTWLVLVVLGVFFVLYLDTFASMYRTWTTIDAFNHCFLIFPISFILIWQDRSALAQLKTSQSTVGLFCVIALSTLWWFSEMVGIQLSSQFSVIAMISAVVLTIMGPVVARSIAFPLAYLLFAVPFGEFLIPYLIDVTAFFSVEAMRIFGIPVIRDGAFFDVPTGRYEVAKACSGIRFVIVTVVISTLMSYIFFQKNWKRLSFVVLAGALAVLANSIRAITIVLVIHFTHFDISAPENHAFVGWAIYALLILVMLAVGRKFGDQAVDIIRDATKPEESDRNNALFALLAVLAITIGPILSLAVPVIHADAHSDIPPFPTALTGWVAASPHDSEWRPGFIGFTGMRIGSFTHSRGRVDLAIVRYLGQRQGKEISNTANYVVQPEEWTILETREVTVAVDSQNSSMLLEVLARHRKKGNARLVWYWIEVNGTPVRGTLKTKIAEIKSAITFTGIRSSAVIVSAPIGSSKAATRSLLQQFIRDNYASLRHCNRVPDDDERCTSETSNMGVN